MELLIIPLVLLAGGILLERGERRGESIIAENRMQEEALEAYISRVSTLLLEQGTMSGGQPNLLAATQLVARGQTLTALRRLDGVRRGALLQFLHDVRLVESTTPIIDLSYADLRGADLAGARLGGINLTFARMEGANLRYAELDSALLFGTMLEGADLRGAVMMETVLDGASMERVNLHEAQVTGEQLSQTTVLYGAIMPNGSLFPEDKEVHEISSEQWEEYGWHGPWG